MEIRRVGIVGAGTMGRGLAAHIAEKGFEVTLIDRAEEQLDKAREAVQIALNHKLEKWAITEAEKRVIETRIRYSFDIRDLGAADVVIESVTEDMAIKKELFRIMDQICHKHTFFASNSSTLSITEMASVTYRPDKVIGLHFLNPVGETELVEIVRGLETSDETYSRAKAFVDKLDKVGIEVYESPGFVTTRLILPLLNEAMYALMEGVATAEDIDTAMKLGFELSKGPLEMADRMGLDTLLILMERLYQEYGDLKYRPCPLLKKYVRAKRLGVKTGEGFFKYDREEKIVSVSNTTQKTSEESGDR